MLKDRKSTLLEWDRNLGKEKIHVCVYIYICPKAPLCLFKKYVIIFAQTVYGEASKMK